MSRQSHGLTLWEEPANNGAAPRPVAMVIVAADGGLLLTDDPSVTSEGSIVREDGGLTLSLNTGAGTGVALKIGNAVRIY